METLIFTQLDFDGYGNWQYSEDTTPGKILG